MSYCWHDSGLEKRDGVLFCSECGMSAWRIAELQQWVEASIQGRKPSRRPSHSMIQEMVLILQAEQMLKQIFKRRQEQAEKRLIDAGVPDNGRRKFSRKIRSNRNKPEQSGDQPS